MNTLKGSKTPGKKQINKQQCTLLTLVDKMKEQDKKHEPEQVPINQSVLEVNSNTQTENKTTETSVNNTCIMPSHRSPDTSVDELLSLFSGSPPEEVPKELNKKNDLKNSTNIERNNLAENNIAENNVLKVNEDPVGSQNDGSNTKHDQISCTLTPRNDSTFRSLYQKYTMSDPSSIKKTNINESFLQSNERKRQFEEVSSSTEIPRKVR